MMTTTFCPIHNVGTLYRAHSVVACYVFVIISSSIVNSCCAAAYVNKGSHSSDSDHSFSDLEDDPRPPEDKLLPQVEGGVIQSASPTKPKPPVGIADVASGDAAMAETLMRNLMPLFVNTFSTTSAAVIRQVALNRKL